MLRRVKHGHGEGDGHGMTVFVNSWNPEYIAAIARDAGGHGLVVAVPVALLQPLRRDDVQ